MKRLIIIALAALGAAASAQAPAPVPPLNTSGVGIDRNGVCWVQGPANVMTQVAPKLGAPVPVTSATQVLPAGVWIVVSSTGTATVITSDGSAVTGVATGNAYPL